MHELNSIPLYKVDQIVECRKDEGELLAGKPYEIVKVTKHDGNVFYWIRQIYFNGTKVQKNVSTLAPEHLLKPKE